MITLDTTSDRTRLLSCFPKGFRRASGMALAGMVASVWIYHGLYSKLLHGSPRHLLIVQPIPGFAGATGECVLATVGVLEIVLGFWVLSGRTAIACAVVQTVGLMAMNLMELTWARSYLLWPAGLVPANLLFLGMAWLSVSLRDGPARSNFGLYRLRRHPIAIDAHFRHCLVLTYAIPKDRLATLLPPGLDVDAYDNFGFLAVAMVRTEGLRPAGWPQWMGGGQILAGYRIFMRFRTNGRTLRGLRIIRSDTNSRRMLVGGNLLTHYNYQMSRATIREDAPLIHVEIKSLGSYADLNVTADLSGTDDAPLPAGSIFRSVHDARRFAGPLPWTFDYEPQTHSIIAIKGVRPAWKPRLVPVNVAELTYFNSETFRGVTPILASAFYVDGIDYRWERGIVHPLPEVPS